MDLRAPSGWQLWLWPALLVVLAVGIWMLPWQGWVTPLRVWVESHGATGWLVFVLVYAVVVMLPLPAAAMSVVGGLAFGWWGLPLSLVGSLVGAIPPWWATQRWLRGPMLRRFGGPRVMAADTAVRDNAFLFVMLLRITPILPFTVQNYLLGLTSVRFVPYATATILGLAPGTLAMVWIGEMGGLTAQGADTARLMVAGGGLLLFGAFILILGKRAAAELRRAGFYGDGQTRS